MDNVKNDAYYIKRLKQDLEFVVTHMKNVDIEELNANEVLLDSMLFRMIQISENAKKLSEIRGGSARCFRSGLSGEPGENG